MFTMLSKLAEILAKIGQGLLAYRRTAKDVDVAEALLRCVTALQDLRVRGEQLLALAEEMVDSAGRAEEFAELVEEQAGAVRSLRSALVEAQALLAAVDAGIYLELVPFLDEKSGLLTRWGKQAADGPLSTTTLFFLPAEALDRVIAIGKAEVTADGLSGERLDYLLALNNSIRSAQSHEVRDLSGAVLERRLPVVKQEIATARADLGQTKVLCEQLLAATEKAVGPEVMARLRWTLVPKPSHG